MAGVKCPLPELGCYWHFGGKRTGSVTSGCCDLLLARSVSSLTSGWPGTRCFVIVNILCLVWRLSPSLPLLVTTQEGVTPVLPSQPGCGVLTPPLTLPSFPLSIPPQNPLWSLHSSRCSEQVNEREGSMIGNNDFKCRHLNKSYNTHSLIKACASESREQNSKQWLKEHCVYQFNFLSKPFNLYHYVGLNQLPHFP